MTDNRLFRSEQDVRQYFIDTIAMTNYSMRQNILMKGIHIDAKLRREILTGDFGGKATIKGKVVEYTFKNLGGGVYSCTVTGNWGYND